MSTSNYLYLSFISDFLSTLKVGLVKFSHKLNAEENKSCPRKINDISKLQSNSKQKSYS